MPIIINFTSLFMDKSDGKTWHECKIKIDALS